MSREFKSSNWAFRTLKQQLFYEFVNLDYGARYKIAVQLGFCADDPFGDCGLLTGDVLADAQIHGLLSELWRLVKVEGGDLGVCPPTLRGKPVSSTKPNDFAHFDGEFFDQNP